MKKKYLLFSCVLLISLFLPLKQVLAMPVGTLLYRTSGDNKMYGYNANDLIVAEKGKLAHIYSGHAAIYIGQEDGVDYIVEMQPKGAIKVPAKYFINESLGEELVGAKIPEHATPNQIAKAVAIAKNLSNKNLAYDFDFKYQKGPFNSQWTCVGLTEKVYESANISNPSNLGALVYDTDNYAVDITRDGYDNQSVYNAAGDCFSSDLEYSKIERKINMIIPAPEIAGFDVGLENNGERFIFLPYTQYQQSTLKDVPVDIELSSSFKEPEVRGNAPILGLVLKWSLINNPISTIKNITSKTSEILLAIKEKVFPESSAVLAEGSTTYDFSAAVSTSTKSVTVKASSTKTSTVKVATSKATTTAKVSATTNTAVKLAVTKATSTKGISATANTSKTVSVSLTPPKSVAVTIPKVTTTTPVVVVPKVTTTTVITKPVVTPVPVITKPVVTPTPTPTPTTTTPVEVEPETKPVALIAKIYSNGDDDWLEIINATNEDFDLAAAGYRLEKAKTGSDPTLIMRFGDEADGTYPGGTVIAAHGYYLIARETSYEEIKTQADAIASKSTFSWTEDGYTLYLGTASISSDEDIDIVDKLGYGTASYYESAPAEALKKGYALERKVSATSTMESLASGGLEELWPRLFDSSDNSADFILVPYDLDLIESENISTSTATSTSGAFENPSGLDSENMTQLWHFDECYGNDVANELQFVGEDPVDLKKSDKWLVGRWGCANVLTDLASSTKATFSSALDPNQMTINYYYRNTADNFSIILKLTNSGTSSKQAYLEITPYFSTIYGFPGPEGRSNDLVWPKDYEWHQFSLVVNRQGGYWSLYLDGKEVYSYKYSGVMPTFSGFEFTSGQGNQVAIDELSFWDRSLPATELRSINLLNQPFNPYTWPEAQSPATLEHHWSFDENTGLITKDSVGTDNFAVKLSQWDMEGINDSALSFSDNVNTTLNSLPVTDLSMSFWWRNTSSPDEGRLHVLLKNGIHTIFGLTPTAYNSTFAFNNSGNYIWEYGKYPIPNDKNWHHFALTYDSYTYWLRFYLDGKQIMERQFIKLKADEKINALEIGQENWVSSIDELKIWSGTLTPSQILAEYEVFK